MIFAEKGWTFPKAQVPVEKYSGRVTLRLSSSMHRRLAEEAEDDGVSLNQHLVNVLNFQKDSVNTASNYSVNPGLADNTATINNIHYDIDPASSPSITSSAPKLRIVR